MKFYVKSDEEVKRAHDKRTSDDKAAIEVMQDNEKYQDNAEVGIFWYNVNSHTLFGVYSTIADSLNWYHSDQFECDIKTEPRLHKDIWKKKSRQSTNSLFIGDYTRVPRGRVFQFKDQGFKVYVGDWIDLYPEAKEQILLEFNLPNDTQFVKDVHWDIGHGWSDEF